MNEILYYLPLLLIAATCNILGGTYYNVDVKDIDFDFNVFFNGAKKALIILSMFVGLAYIFDKMPELTDAIGVTPTVIMISAIVLYVGKVILTLAKILGVKADTKE